MDGPETRGDSHGDTERRTGDTERLTIETQRLGDGGREPISVCRCVADCVGYGPALSPNTAEAAPTARRTISIRDEDGLRGATPPGNTSSRRSSGW